MQCLEQGRRGRRGIGGPGWADCLLAAALAILMACSAAAGSQTAPGDREAGTSHSAILSLGRAGEGTRIAGEGGRASEIIRTIDDPNLGDRWLLMRSAGQFGGPGRLLRTRQEGVQSSATFLGGSTKPAPSGTDPATDPATDPSWRVRAGEPVLVEEHSAVVDAYLEGVALGPASAGTLFRVRLRVGARIVDAVAMGPGRAVLKPTAERVR